MTCNSAGQPKPLFDPQQVADTAKLLIGAGQVTEVRVLEATTTKSNSWPHTVSGYFDDADKLVAALAVIRTAKGIYFTPNPVDPALLSRAANRIKKASKGESTQDTNIVERRWLLIDADPQRLSGISATDGEHEAALQRAREIQDYLRGLGWPEPILADSGNGAHLLYCIDLPTDDGGLIKRCLAAIAERFDDNAVKIDQSVHNPARTWKLYGTRACKGDDTSDRPHRMSRILSQPDELHVVLPNQLESLAAESPQNAATPAHPEANVNGQAFDVESFIARNKLDVDGPHDWNNGQGPGKRWVLKMSPMCEHHDGAAFIGQLGNGAISAGCHHNSCKWGWTGLRRKLEPPTNGRQRHNADPQVGITQSSGKPATRIEVFRPFPTDLLPNHVRQCVNQGAAAIGCDPSYIAVPLLTAAAAAIGNSRVIQLKPGWNEPAILWSGIIGYSGTMKSPAMDIALRSLRKKQAAAIREYQAQMDAYEVEKAAYEQQLKTRKNQSAKIASPPLEKPKEPVAERFLCDDITVEALSIRLKDQPRGLLCARDELSAFFGDLDRYTPSRGGDAPKYLAMHGGRQLMGDRKTGNDKSIFVPRASLSVTGGIQPGLVRRVLAAEHRESGMAARFLFTSPPRRTKKWTEDEIDERCMVEIDAIFYRLYGLEMDTTEDGEIVPRVVVLDPAAKAEFIEFFNEHNEEQSQLDGDLAAAFSKLEGYAARFALVIHLTRWAAVKTLIPRSSIWNLYAG